MKKKHKSKRTGFGKLLLLAGLILLGAGTALGAYAGQNGVTGRPGRNAGSAVLPSVEEKFREAVKQGEEKAEEESGKYASDPADAPKVRIVLDPGHGGPGYTDEQELGAVYRNTCEKFLTLVIAEALGKELSAYGNVEIFYTREQDQAMTLKERAAYAASVDADVLISLHLNASEEHNLFGSEVFVSAYDRDYAYGKGLGEKILGQLQDYGFASKGVKTRLGSHGDYYGIIRECRSLGIPAVIVEHGYMDEDRDWTRMDSGEKLQEIGRRDAAGIAAYFGLEKGRTLAEPAEPELVLPGQSPVQPDVTAPEDVWYTLIWREEGLADITLHASEPESRLMYYDWSLDGGETYQPLELWTGSDSMTFSLELDASQEQSLVIRVYNNYELRTEAERCLD